MLPPNPVLSFRANPGRKALNFGVWGRAQKRPAWLRFLSVWLTSFDFVRWLSPSVFTSTSQRSALKASMSVFAADFAITRTASQSQTAYRAYPLLDGRLNGGMRLPILFPFAENLPTRFRQMPGNGHGYPAVVLVRLDTIVWSRAWCPA